MDNNKPLAIVIGRYYTTRLTLIRAAGMVGCDVVVIQTDSNQKRIVKIDASSKYVVGYEISHEPNQKELINKIRKYECLNRKVILLPADDYAASVIDLNFDILKNNFLLPHINHHQGGIIKVMDKAYQKVLARESGFDTARSWIAVYKDGVFTVPTDIEFPCFVKSEDSYKCGGLKKLQKKCNTREELHIALNNYMKVSHNNVLIEEYIEIDNEYGVQGVAIDNCVVAPAAIRKDSVLMGITVSGHIFPIDTIEMLREKLAVFIQKTQLNGIFDVEFFISRGKLYFNELNLRLGANGFALTYGVANVPGLYIKHMLGMNTGKDSIPKKFTEKSFASEQALKSMCVTGKITYKQYKDYLRKSDILSLSCENDNQPFVEYKKRCLLMPLRIKLSHIKKTISGFKKAYHL